MVLTRRIDTEAIALQRQGELGFWASLLGQEAPRSAPAERCARRTGLPHLSRAWRRLVPRRRPADAARAVSRDESGRLGPARATASTCTRSSSARRPCTPPVTRWVSSATARSAPATRPRHRGVRLLRRWRIEPGRRQRGVRLRRAPTTRPSCSSARTTSGRSRSRSSAVPDPAVPPGDGFGFPGIRVDGNDVLAVHAVTTATRWTGRVGHGPHAHRGLYLPDGRTHHLRRPEQVPAGGRAGALAAPGSDRPGTRLPRSGTRRPTPTSSRDVDAEADADGQELRAGLPARCRTPITVVVRPRVCDHRRRTCEQQQTGFADYLAIRRGPGGAS